MQRDLMHDAEAWTDRAGQREDPVERRAAGVGVVRERADAGIEHAEIGDAITGGGARRVDGPCVDGDARVRSLRRAERDTAEGHTDRARRAAHRHGARLRAVVGHAHEARRTRAADAGLAPEIVVDAAGTDPVGIEETARAARTVAVGGTRAPASAEATGERRGALCARGARGSRRGRGLTGGERGQHRRHQPRGA